jgi:uncharacterized protein YndB with AHSA1/START domain
MARVPPIEQTFYYALPPNRVFAALTEPKALAGWFVEKADVTLEKGATFRLTWPGGYTMTGRVRSVRPPSRLGLSWIDQFEGGKVFETEVRFDLRRRGKGTLLTVSHRGFKKGKRWVALYGSIQSGWAYYLTNLRSVLEHGVDLRSSQDALG